MKKLSVYIHIPFCVSKCAYCDFLSFAGRGELHAAYADALASEIVASKTELADYAAETVYFGGGTPTALPASALVRLLDALRGTCKVLPDAEITSEANPETANPQNLSELRAAGFNRLSLGIQSFDDNLLKRVNRAHSAETARDAYAAACEAGFENIGIDLMFSIPGQTTDNFERTLRQAADLSPEHISCYGLTVEPGSSLAGDGYEPDEEADRAMYALAREILPENGYEHYEISNFAIPGHRSRHNTAYWNGQDYRGFGLGAHSLINGARFHAGTCLESYIASNGASPRQNVEFLRESDMRAEFMILGLRLLDGINCEDFSRKFDKNIYREYGAQIKELTAQGLLEASGNRIRLTPRGIDLSNQVFAKFI
ncbi:MAG: radical SAM family heme chaperone HemW [Defluviitaleaceae bacterium]|nr:radical SAM family heme chaperone HemW [Defluviitaleaceae bacterium]MCL2836487.1 radical SAM family heme chaperone HemW [Defluviitaleaceae bacterium]